MSIPREECPEACEAASASPEYRLFGGKHMATPRDEMNSVCHTAGNFAFEQIEKHGDLVPFAVAIDREGVLRFVALGEDQIIDGGEKDIAKVCKVLQAGAKQGRYIATAVASDVRVRMPEGGEVTDAIRVQVEHVRAAPITCILPYRRKKETVEQHTDPYLEPGERLVFPERVAGTGP